MSSQAGSRHEIAADWLQRLDAPELREDEIQAWLEWFGASDENREAFEELQNLRRAFRELSPEAGAELKRRTGVEPMASFVATPSERSQSKDREPPAPFSRTGGSTRLRRSVTLPLALAASLSAIALALGTWWMQRTNVAVYSAPVDRHRTVQLEDGSSLILGADSSVSVAYSRRIRSVDVQRGEAYFEVRHDMRRPFVVEAAGIQVTALGTAFNVHRGADKVTVTVTDGRVAIDGPATQASAAESANAKVTKKRLQQTRILGVGQQTVVTLDVPSARGALARTSSSQWQDGRADFINAPLSEVLPVINSYAHVKLVIDDPRVADLTYSGTIFRSHLDEWVASLTHLYPIRAVPLQNGTITLVSRDER